MGNKKQIAKIDDIVNNAKLSKESVLESLFDEFIRARDYVELLDKRIHEEYKKRRKE